MTKREILEEFKKLNPEEKILLVEDMWDTIESGREEIPVPEWRLKELDDRYADYKSGDMELYDWECMHKAVRERIN